jgi:hypothetical protein
MIERELLSDHAAHRSADQVGLLHSRGVEHGERVSDHVRHRQTLVDARGGTGAAVIEGDRAMASRDVGQQAPPHRAAAGEPHDHQQRLGILHGLGRPADRVADSAGSCRRERHRPAAILGRRPRAPATGRRAKTAAPTLGTRSCRRSAGTASRRSDLLGECWSSSSNSHRPNYTFDLDTTGWGWIHLILGALLIATGVGLFSR